MVVLVASLIMLILGAYLTYNYSRPVQEKIMSAQSTVNVPGNEYRVIDFKFSYSGFYYAQVSVTNGTVKVYSSNVNTTEVMTNGTPIIANNSVDGRFLFQYVGGEILSTGYIFLSNPNSFTETVRYNVYYNLTYNNYFALLAGIALIPLAIITLLLSIFKNKLSSFNKALENQE